METKEKQVKKKYTLDFKKKVAELSYQRSEVASVAKELGLSLKNVSRCRNEYKLGMYNEDYKPSVNSLALQESIQLKKEIKNLQIENAILKKAMSIFCVDNRKNMSL